MTKSSSGLQHGAATVGVLRIGRKRPGFDQEWNGIMTQACLRALGDLGRCTAGGDEPVIDNYTLPDIVSKA